MVSYFVPLLQRLGKTQYILDCANGCLYCVVLDDLTLSKDVALYIYIYVCMYVCIKTNHDWEYLGHAI